MRRLRRHALSLVVALAALLAPLASCAKGIADAGDDGGATNDDGPLGEGAVGEGGEGGPSTAAIKACGDLVGEYCDKLQSCANFQILAGYGDTITCKSRLLIYCKDMVSAPGTGWTGDGLEACVKVGSAWSCDTFLYGKPQPSECRPVGTIDNGQPCKYDSQCRTGYCRVASGSCGNCATLGLTNAACSTYADCDGDLMCAANSTCQPPSAVGASCDTTHPCKRGLACIGAQCKARGKAGDACNPALGGADCDSGQGIYCSASDSTCTADVVAQAGQPCNVPTQQTVCTGGGTCVSGTCEAAVADGQPCSSQGAACQSPATCVQSLCSFVKASSCQ